MHKKDCLLVSTTKTTAGCKFLWTIFDIHTEKVKVVLSRDADQTLQEPFPLNFILSEGIMSTPLGGGYIIFAFFAVRCPMSDVRRPASGVRCPASRMVSAHLKEKY